MQHIITWAEIAVTDMQRAIDFYTKALNVSFKRDEMGGADYAMFEAEEEAVSGALVAGEGYNPSADGSIIYLNGGDDLAEPLARIKQMGHQIIIEKTAINEGECGFFAQFIDSEGNRIGLYSLK